MLEPEKTDKDSFLDAQNPVYLKMSSVNNYAKLIEVRIEFLSIGEVDTMNEKYEAEVKIKSRWYDDEEIFEYDKKKHWYPKLFIENALHDVKEEITYHVDRIQGKSIITETRIAKGKFWERIELHNFPIDIQELSITFASKLKPNKVKLVSDSEKISNIHSEALHTFRDQQKFKLYKMVQVSESASYDLGSSSSVNKTASDGGDPSEFKQINYDSQNQKRSKLVATCFCSRRPGYYLLNVYSFNFLITVLSLTIFAIETRVAQSRISGTFTLILTSVSFKTTLSRTIPTISYMTSLDRYQIISIIYLVMCCVWHSTIASLDVDLQIKIIIDKSVLLLFAAVFLSIQIVFSIGILKAYKKIKALEKSEAKFLAQDNTIESDDEA